MVGRTRKRKRNWFGDGKSVFRSSDCAHHVGEKSKIDSTLIQSRIPTLVSLAKSLDGSSG